MLIDEWLRVRPAIETNNRQSPTNRQSKIINQQFGNDSSARLRT